jgi:hypothetical protein
VAENCKVFLLQIDESLKMDCMDQNLFGWPVPVGQMVVHSLLSLRVIEPLNRKRPVKLPAASVLPAMLGHMTPNIHRPSTRNHLLLAGRF